MRAAIYVRIAGNGYRAENELAKFHYFACERDWQIMDYLDDDRAGSRRAEFDGLFTDASEHRFHVVLFWALDRFISEGPVETLDYLNRLTECGIWYCSATQHYIDTTGFFKSGVIEVVAAIAKQKCSEHARHVSCGPGSAGASNSGPGRPHAVFQLDEAIELHRSGLSWRQVARKLGVGTATIRRAYKEASAARQNPEGGIL